jgi:hypothetical protein
MPISGSAHREKFAFVFQCGLRGSIGGERLGRFGFICAPSASRGHLGERAADPLHRARINAKALGDAAHTFTSALTLVQGRLDSFLKLGGYPRSAESFALVLGPPKTSADSFCNHRALELGKHAHHLKHGFASRRRGVETLLMQKQVDVQGMQFRQETDQVLQAAAKPVHRPRHHHVELALSRIPKQPVKLRPPIATFSATDAVVLVDADDFTAHPAGDLPQFPLLIGGGLVDGRNPKIEDGYFTMSSISAFHLFLSVNRNSEGDEAQRHVCWAAASSFACSLTYIIY